MKATLELVSRIALAWMDKRPFSAEARAARKAARAERKEARRARRHARQAEVHVVKTIPAQPLPPDAIDPGFWDWNAPDGAEERGMLKLIMDALAARRTSTKGGVAGVVAVYVIDWVQQAAPGLLGDKAEDYALLAVVWLVSRLSKTPAEPGVL